MITDNDLTADQGSTIIFDFTCYADETTPFVLTDYDIVFTARKSYQGRVEFLASTENGNIVITNGAAGQCTVMVPPEDTAKITSTGTTQEIPLVYDLELTSPLGRVYKASRGTLTLIKEVSK